MNLYGNVSLMRLRRRSETILDYGHRVFHLTPKGAGYDDKARLRGLNQATEVVFVPVAEGFSPTGCPSPEKICRTRKAQRLCDTLCHSDE